MKFTYYVIRLPTKIELCSSCPCCNSISEDFNFCNLTNLLIGSKTEPQDIKCPLIPIDGRVEQ